MQVGDLVKGTVSEINNSGVVVALSEQIQGFLPKSETSWERDAVVAELFAVGQEVELKVIELDLAKKRIILSFKQLTENPWEVLNLNVNDEVTCKVVKVIEQGVKLVVEGASAFLPTNNFGEKTEFAEGEEFTAKVRVFDAPKHKLIVTLKVEAPKVKAPKKQNNDNELKYMSQDKVSNTFGDFINLDDYK